MSDFDSDDDSLSSLELTPGERRHREERKERRRLAKERAARDAAVHRASVAVRLEDKGTRLGSELWVASGCVVTTRHCPMPCLLTLASTIPDPYNGAHATVYFSGGSTAKLACDEFFVSSGGEIGGMLIEDFDPAVIPVAALANYSLAAISTPLPPTVAPLDLDAEEGGEEDERKAETKADALGAVCVGSSVVAVQSAGASGEPGAVLIARVETLSSESITLVPVDPTTDKALLRGCPVFRRDESDSLHLAALHEGHAADEAAPGEEKTEGIPLYSHGYWRHRCASLGPILLHLKSAVVVLERRAAEKMVKMEAFFGKGNARRERITSSLETLHAILADPSAPPPEIFEPAAAQLLADQAQGHGMSVVLILLRIYNDEEVARCALGALGRLLTGGGRACTTAEATDLGAPELVARALQAYPQNAPLVGNASWCLALLAASPETSRRLLQCDGSASLCAALKQVSGHGQHHLVAQKWGLNAVAVFARSTHHRRVMIREAILETLPLLISNHPYVLVDLELQMWGLNCVMELCAGSEDSAGEGLLDAGLMAALRKVRKGVVGSKREWKELAEGVFDELGWEQ